MGAGPCWATLKEAFRGVGRPPSQRCARALPLMGWSPGVKAGWSERGLSDASCSSTAPPRRVPPGPTWEEFTSFETYIFDCDGVIWGIGEDDTRTSVETINVLLER